MQYYDTGYLQILFVVLLMAFILFNIQRARGGKQLFIRRIPGLSAIDEAIGRSTEMGRPVLMVPGLSGLDPVGIQAIKIFGYITRTAARFGTPIRLLLANAPLYSVATEMIRDVYQTEGVPERFDPQSVRFVTDRQFAFAAGVAGLIYRERVAAAFLMGDWYAESLIVAESANAVGAIQVAASTITTQTPFLIAACDYVMIGDEFYAASAYLSREPVLVGSLVGQDWSKLAIAVLIVASSLYGSFEKRFVQQTMEWVQEPGKAGEMRPIPARMKNNDEILPLRFFSPRKPGPLDPPRQKKPGAENKTGGDS
ncbi:MAG TPA: hypothetical protein DER07_05445 [Armatimonadetes bacterium]|nr:hypothetical protein [Armatimonadota bacterium]HCE00466.1 hypothetical protein [Armatimonadota bacterium]